MRAFPEVESRTGVRAQDLAAEVAGRERPIVFKGAVADWPVVKAGLAGADVLAAHLRAADNGREPETFRQGAGDGRFFYGQASDGFNFQRAHVPLSLTLDRLLSLRGQATGKSSGEHIYIQSAPLKDFLPALKADNRLPGIDAEPRIWIGNASETQIHFDLYDNLACMVGGKKRFIIFPPDQAANLYMGPVETTVSGVPTSMVSLKDPDLAVHPRFPQALAAASAADLEPGDVLYMPYMWWHHVVSSEDLNVQINYWWNAAGSEMGQAMHALLLAMLNIRDLPPHQIAAWRAMFDHFVFGDGIADHLPAEKRGILGALSPESRAAIRRQIGKAMTDG